MEPSIHRRLVYVAGVLVLTSGFIHLTLGIAGLLDPSIVDAQSLALPVVFLVAALILYAGIGLYATGRLDPQIAYVLGALLMAVYVLAYVDWHVMQVGQTVLPLEVVGLEHDYTHTLHSPEHGGQFHHDHVQEDSDMSVLIDHLRDDAFALVSKTAESIAVVLLTILAIEESRYTT